MENFFLKGFLNDDSESFLSNLFLVNVFLSDLISENLENFFLKGFLNDDSESFLSNLFLFLFFLLLNLLFRDLFLLESIFVLLFLEGLKIF